MNTLRKLVIPGVLTAALVGLIVPSVAQASTVAAHHSAPISFDVSPTRVVVPASRHAETVKATIINTGHVPITLTSSVRQLIQRTKGGFSSIRPMPGSGAQWVTVSPAKVTIKHYLGRATVLVRIAVPVQHAPGQKALSVVWVTTNHAKVKGSGAVVETAIASPEMIVNVTGKVVNNTRMALHAPTFSMGGSIPVTLTTNNRGNVYALRNGLSVTDGPKPAVQFAGELLLAGSHTSITKQWTSPPTFGFPAHLTLHSNGQVVATASVWIVPVPLVLGALTVLTCLVLMLVLMRRRRNRIIDREIARRTAPAPRGIGLQNPA